MSKSPLRVFSLFLGLAVLVAFLVIKAQWNDQTTIDRFLRETPQKDLINLEAFFRSVLIDEHCAYTVFGDKPISLAMLIDVERSPPEHREIMEQSETLQYEKTRFEGWKAWQKYQTQFSNRKLCIRLVGDDNQELVTVLIINKKQLVNSVKRHKKLFKHCLGHNMTPAKLLRAFEKQKNPFEEALKEHHDLAGILFGYGEQNAALFHRRRVIECASCNIPTLCPKCINKYPKPSPGFASLDEELQTIEKRLKPFSTKDTLPLRLPMFLADQDTQESKALRAKYEAQRQKILQTLEKNSFLKEVLKALR